MRLNVLGPIEVIGSAATCRVRGFKLAKVTGLLALRANHFVSMETISEELWSGSPPRNEATTIRTHVYNLRRVLSSSHTGPSSGVTLHTRPMGYQLSIPDELLDVSRFDRLANEGRALFDGGRYAESADRLRAALGVWRGNALEGISVGPVLSGHLAHLGEKRARILELRIEADMRSGRHRDLVPELYELVAIDPLNEWLQAQLMEVLHRSGRRGEALRSFHDARRCLDEQLGIEPSDDLHQTYLQILSSGYQR
ncbi:AfsR/SARP family transcriptional regulator [Streptomyces mayteni]